MGMPTSRDADTTIMLQRARAPVREGSHSRDLTQREWRRSVWRGGSRTTRPSPFAARRPPLIFLARQFTGLPIFRLFGGVAGAEMAGFLSLDGLFEGRHFDREIIVLCVRWHLRFKLSFRDLAEMMAERNLSMAHTTIMRGVHHYAPEFERRWNRFARPTGFSWRVDETYVKVCGKWVYLYRAVDRAGKTVDFRLSPRRDVAAAKAFLRRAIRVRGGSAHDHVGRLRGIIPSRPGDEG